MKKILLVVVALAIVTMAGAAMAADTAVVTVSATVADMQVYCGGYSGFRTRPICRWRCEWNSRQPTFWVHKRRQLYHHWWRWYMNLELFNEWNTHLAEYIGVFIHVHCCRAGTGPADPYHHGHCQHRISSLNTSMLRPATMRYRNTLYTSVGCKVPVQAVKRGDTQ